ncbi:MAG: glycosyltransferase family 4 protein, partial [Acidobacteriaceae bacterium]|nr:glycosyltransferase family 4 protein [Acidobacteriaceae bacterium]
MRVLQLGPYPPPHGGVQSNLMAIRHYLRSHGATCGVINLTRHRSTNGDEVYFPKNAAETLWLIAKLPYDILHLHIGGNLTFRLLALSLLCCWMPRRKAVLTFHSGGYATSPEGRSASPRTLAGFVLRRFDRIIAVNEEIVDLFRRFGVANDRVYSIKPHAMPARITDTPLPTDLAAFFAARSPALLTVGLLEDEYDLPIQVELLGRLLRDFHQAGLAIIGSGSRESALRALIASKEYASRVLLCGDVPHSATLRSIAQCHIFLRTTLYDGDAISVREALHLGTPVIATDNGMRPQGVRLVPISNLDALEEETRRVISTGMKKNTRQQTGETNL